jgi:hypothetical protein
MAKGQRDSNREAFWRGVLGKHRGSGLNIRAFCQREKVSEPSFYAWRRVVQERDAAQPRRVQQRGGTRRPVRPAFVPVVVRDDRDHDANLGFTIELSCGSRTRVLRLPVTIAPDRLAELVRAVESVPVAGEARP